MTPPAPVNVRYQAASPLRSRQRQRANGAVVSLRKAVVFGMSLVMLSGCGGTVGYPTGTTTPVSSGPFTSITGNWQMTLTSNSGNVAFSSFGGFINEATTASNGTAYITSVFQVVPGNCFLGATTIPSTGGVAGGALSLSAFPVNNQYLTLQATQDSAGTHLSGSLQIANACANGVAANFTGTRFDALTGIYTGPYTGPANASSTATMALHLTQSALGDGNGYSLLSGSAVFSGVSCFTRGNLGTVGNTVVGQNVHLTITANDNEVVTLFGTFDAAATAIIITSGEVTGGSCAGAFTPGTTLPLQTS